MTDKKEDENMSAVRKEDLKATQAAAPAKQDRKQTIRSIAERICDQNDEGLRRLSKN